MPKTRMASKLPCLLNLPPTNMVDCHFFQSLPDLSVWEIVSDYTQEAPNEGRGFDSQVSPQLYIRSTKTNTATIF